MDNGTLPLPSICVDFTFFPFFQFKAIESRVAQCRHVMDAEEVKDLQAAMRQGQLTVSSLQASLTIQKTTVIVTSTSKEQADKTMATVKVLL